VADDENGRRSRDEPEFELMDTGVFDQGRYWAVDVAYAKASATEVLAKITIKNHAAEAATLSVLPTLWFRNTWRSNGDEAPNLFLDGNGIAVDHPRLYGYRLDAAPTADGVRPLALFCDNETNNPRLFGADPLTEFPKDGINDHVISGAKTVNPDERGTKACWWYKITVPAGGAPRYALGSIGLINRPQPRAMDGMAATSKPSWQTGNGKRTSSTPLWRPMTSAKNTCGCYGSRARV
jgi:hypothetical protein